MQMLFICQIGNQRYCTFFCESSTSLFIYILGSSEKYLLFLCIMYILLSLSLFFFFSFFFLKIMFFLVISTRCIEDFWEGVPHRIIKGMIMSLLVRNTSALIRGLLGSPKQSYESL